MNELSTEQKILDAAKLVFLKKGKAGARMQEIADEAGINKALLHYYYKNKETLFRGVFEQTLRDFIPRFVVIFRDRSPLPIKINRMVSEYIDFLKANPELPLFVLSELQSDPDRLIAKLEVKGMASLDDIQAQLDQGAKAGMIRNIKAEHLMLNLMSMIVFPFVAGHIFTNVFEVPREQYNKILEERKRIIPEFLLNALKP